MGQSTRVRAASTQDRTISDIMRRILFIEEEREYGTVETRVKDFDEWVSKAVEIALDIFPETPNQASRDNKISDVRKAVFSVGFAKFVSTMDISKLYSELGVSVAKHTGRAKHYHRATVMHALAVHNDRISLPKFYNEYYLNYKYLCKSLRELRLL